MTKQTFDPYGSTSWPDMLDQAKLSLVWNPIWPKLKGTPFENDVPVWMAEFAQKYLERHRVRESGELVEVCKRVLQEIEFMVENHNHEPCFSWKTAKRLKKLITEIEAESSKP